MELKHFKYTAYNPKYHRAMKKGEKELKPRLITGKFLFNTWKEIKRNCCNVLLPVFDKLCPGGQLPSGKQMVCILISVRRVFFDASERSKDLKIAIKSASTSSTPALVEEDHEDDEEEVQEAEHDGDDSDSDAEEEDEAKADPEALEANVVDELLEKLNDVNLEEAQTVSAARERRFLKFFTLHWLPGKHGRDTQRKTALSETIATNAFDTAADSTEHTKQARSSSSTSSVVPIVEHELDRVELAFIGLNSEIHRSNVLQEYELKSSRLRELYALNSGNLSVFPGGDGVMTTEVYYKQALVKHLQDEGAVKL
jgi:hypothetical protein